MTAHWQAVLLILGTPCLILLAAALWSERRNNVLLQEAYGALSRERNDLRVDALKFAAQRDESMRLVREQAQTMRDMKVELDFAGIVQEWEV